MKRARIPQQQHRPWHLLMSGLLLLFALLLVQPQPASASAAAVASASASASGPPPRKLEASPPPSSPSNSSIPGPSPTTSPPQDPLPIISTDTVSPTLTPTFAPSPAPTPMPTQKPPDYISITFDLFISFPQPVPADLTVGAFRDNVQAQSTVKDALSLAITVVKRPDIGVVKAVRQRNQLELTLRVTTTTLVATSGYIDPLQFFNALRRQMYTAKEDGTLNRSLQNAATTNGVNAMTQAFFKSYNVPNRFQLNGEFVMVDSASAVGDKGRVPEGVPLPVLIPSILAALFIFIAMVVSSRQMAEAYEQTLEEAAEVAAVQRAALLGREGGGNGGGGRTGTTTL